MSEALAVQIPDVVRSVARSLGAADWLGDLPELVAEIARAWDLSVGDAYEHATEAFVAAATMSDGTPVVLKLPVPRARPAARHEATVLQLADGRGCVRLLAFDESRGALLLEQLGPPMSSLGMPFDRRLEILTDLAVAAWQPASGCELPTGAVMAERFAEEIPRLWGELDCPCEERIVDHALACARRRLAAHDDERSVLVHGDVHQWNALSADTGFALVDPDGVLAEPEYDLGVLMREDPEEIVGDARDRATLLARRTGLDAEAIWEWGVTQRVWNGLLGSQNGIEPYASQALEVADRIASLEH